MVAVEKRAKEAEQRVKELEAEIASGTPARLAPDAVSLPKYESWAMYAQWLALNAWKIWLEGHLGPF